MASLKLLLEQARFETSPATSIRAVATKFGLASPISTLRVARLLKPETWTWKADSIATHSDPIVSATARLDLESTGAWTFSGEVQDGGDGAGFALQLVPTVVDSSGHTVLFLEVGQLSEKGSASFSYNGKTSWISRNWDALRNGGFHYRLDANATEGIGGLIIILPILVIVGMILGAKHCNDNDSWQVQTNADGSTHAVCGLG